MRKDRKYLYLLVVFLVCNSSTVARDSNIRDKFLEKKVQQANELLKKKDYKKVKAIYNEIFESISLEEDLNTDTAYIALNYGLSLIELKDFDQLEALLSILQARAIPEEFRELHLLLQVKLLIVQHDFMKGYELYHAYQDVNPIENWDSQHKTLYFSILSALNNECHQIWEALQPVIKAKSLQKSDRDLCLRLLESINLGIFSDPQPFLEPSKSPDMEFLLRSALAASFASTGDYALAVAQIEQLSKRGDILNDEMLDLWIESLLKLEKWEQVAALFENLENLSNSLLYKKAQFSFLMGKPAKARQSLNSMNADLENDFIWTLKAKTLFIAMQIQDHAYNEAWKALREIKEKLIKDPHLKLTTFPILGNIYFLEGNFAQAEQVFTQNLSNQSITYLDEIQIQQSLGWCYLYLSLDTSSKTEAIRYLNQAKTLFQKLEALPNTDSVKTGLAMVYGYLGIRFSDPDYLDKSRKLLTSITNPSLEYYWCHYLISKDKAILDNMFLLLQQSSTRSTLYLNMVYQLGLEYEHQARISSKIEEKELHFSKASKLYYYYFKSTEALQSIDSLKALRLSALCDYEIKNKKGLGDAFKKARYLLNIYESKNQRPLALVYFCATLGWEHYYHIRDPLLIKQIEPFFRELQHSSSEYTSKSLFYLAMIAIEREDLKQASLFLNQLIRDYPDSPIAVEGLYTLSQVYEKLSQPDKVKELQLQLIEQYPDAPMTEQVYYDFYVRQPPSPQVERALKEFIRLYPNSRLLVGVYNALGDLCVEKMDEKQALTYYNQAISSYDLLDRSQKLSSNSQIDIIFNDVLLKKGKILRTHFEKQLPEKEFLNEALLVLEKGIKRIDALSADERMAIYGHASLPVILQKYELELAHILLLNGQTKEAKQTLSHLLQTFNQNKLLDSYFYYETWFLLSKLSIQEAAFSDALQCLLLVEQGIQQKKIKTIDLARVKLMQSECYEKEKSYDQALLCLSKVINDPENRDYEAEAMYKRGQLYRLMGQEELAYHQFQEVAKTDTNWGNKAKKILKF